MFILLDPSTSRFLFVFNAALSRVVLDPNLLLMLNSDSFPKDLIQPRLPMVRRVPHPRQLRLNCGATKMSRLNLDLNDFVESGSTQF